MVLTLHRCSWKSGHRTDANIGTSRYLLPFFSSPARRIAWRKESDYVCDPFLDEVTSREVGVSVRSVYRLSKLACECLH